MSNIYTVLTRFCGIATNMSARILRWIKALHDPRYQLARIMPGVDLKGDVIFKGQNVINKGAVFRGHVSVGYASTIGVGNILRGGMIVVGNYCQFGPYVSIYAVNHPTSYLSTYVSNTLFQGRLKKNKQEGQVTIGNDVWIGHGATILQGVTIGNGAIIGAGSVVTHDVPDYCITAGNPARIIRQRFSNELIELLLDLGWWDYTAEELEEMEELFMFNLNDNQADTMKFIHNYMKRFKIVN